jgi:hypothetical protein
MDNNFLVLERKLGPYKQPELYPKLVGIVLTRMLSAKIKEILGPVQLGCGFQFATEASSSMEYMNLF